MTHDIGSHHIVAYYLTLEVRSAISLFLLGTRLPPQRIGRYLDGEEEVEGLYR